MQERNETTDIIVHCSDSESSLHHRPLAIRAWHIQRGFEDIGYHFIITKDGEGHVCRPINLVGAHCKDQGMNHKSIGICLTGKHDFSHDQMVTLGHLIARLKSIYVDIEQVSAHSRFNKGKTCPNFNLNIFDTDEEE